MEYWGITCRWLVTPGSTSLHFHLYWCTLSEHFISDNALSYSYSLTRPVWTDWLAEAIFQLVSRPISATGHNPELKMWCLLTCSWHTLIHLSLKKATPSLMQSFLNQIKQVSCIKHLHTVLTQGRLEADLGEQLQLLVLCSELCNIKIKSIFFCLSVISKSKVYNDDLYVLYCLNQEVESHTDASPYQSAPGPLGFITYIPL